MNVTHKLPDQLCRKARHQADDESKSLSAWVADLVAAKLSRASASGKTLLEALGDETLANGDFGISPRNSGRSRPVEFP